MAFHAGLRHSSAEQAPAISNFVATVVVGVGIAWMVLDRMVSLEGQVRIINII